MTDESITRVLFFNIPLYFSSCVAIFVFTFVMLRKSILEFTRGFFKGLKDEKVYKKSVLQRYLNKKIQTNNWYAALIIACSIGVGINWSGLEIMYLALVGILCFGLTAALCLFVFRVLLSIIMPLIILLCFTPIRALLTRVFAVVLISTLYLLGAFISLLLAYQICIYFDNVHFLQMICSTLLAYEAGRIICSQSLAFMFKAFPGFTVRKPNDLKSFFGFCAVGLLLLYFPALVTSTFAIPPLDWLLAQFPWLQIPSL